MKIYTKTGDDGTTGLIGGGRVRKSDPRLDAYGTVDELNALLGAAAALATVAPADASPAAAHGAASPPAPSGTAASPATADTRTDAALPGLLHRVMDDLFVVGSHLAAPAAKREAAHLPPLTDALAARLEAEIDAAEATLAPLTQFILPGGTDLAARLHVARTVCRRAERRLADLPPGDVEPALLAYVNRLSDWLFVQARAANAHAGVPDVPWRKG